MTFSLRLAPLVLALVLPVVAGAQHRAPNHHKVYDLGNGTFEVVSQPGSGASHLWCGAGDFAHRKLNVAATQRIYMVQGIGPSVNKPRRKSAVFSLVPPAGVDPETARNPITLSLRGVGDSFSSASAIQYCRDHLGEREIWVKP